jgi:hypothetical protein
MLSLPSYTHSLDTHMLSLPSHTHPCCLHTDRHTLSLHPHTHVRINHIHTLSCTHSLSRHTHVMYVIWMDVVLCLCCVDRPNGYDLGLLSCVVEGPAPFRVNNLTN